MGVGLILFPLIGIISGHWGEAAIVGIIVGVIVSMFQDDKAEMRAYYNRRDYWAYGKEPDWKRKQRAERAQAERDSARLKKARQVAAAGRWDEVPWSLRGKIRKEQEDHDAWMAEQERIAEEKRRKYMEQMRANRRKQNVIKYRPHRATLQDAMKEAREFETYEDMKRHVLREHAIWNTDGITPFGLDDIVIDEPHGDDDRIGWKNVRYVCVKRYGSKDYMKLYGCPQCIGMCGE